MPNAFYLGVDPSLRHVGICVLAEGQPPRVFEIKTGDLSVWEAGWKIREDLKGLFQSSIDYETELVLGMERQVPHSGILFYVQMIIVEVVLGRVDQSKLKVVMPLPIQLKSYMRKQMKLDISTKKSIVEGVQANWFGGGSRLSSHRAEAYCLAMMASDVVNGKWELRLPEKETPIVPKELVYGTRVVEAGAPCRS